MKSSLVRRRRVTAQLSSASNAALPPIETLEERRLFAISLASAVSTPLSTVPTGDPAAPVIADFDGDSVLDVLVAFPSKSAIDAGFIQFGKGDGAGSFAIGAAVDVGVFTGRPVTGDFDGDGELDFAVTNAFAGQVKVMRGNGDGTFAAAQTFTAGVSPESLATADLNGDTRADLVVGNRSDNTVSVYLGNAGTTLGAATTIATATDPASVALADFTREGNVDILVGASGGQNAASGSLQVFAGNGDGTFSASPLTTAGPRGVTAVADIDRSSGLDVIVGISDRDRADALVNTGNGTFELTPGSTGASAVKSAVAIDLDQNSFVDLVSAVGGRIDVLPGNGNGTFGNAISFDAAGGSGPAAADLTGDGRADVLTITAAPGTTTGRTLNVSLGQRVGPDLTIAFETPVPASVLSDAKAKQKVRITNNGNETLKTSTPVQLYASTDTTVDTNDTLLIQTNSKLSIKPGKSKVVTLKYNNPAASGDFNYIARVDPLGTTGDLNVLDNAVQSQGLVTVGQAFVDLAGEIPAIPAGPLSIGDKVTVELQVTNEGNITGSGKVAFALTASTDSTSDANDTLLKFQSPRFKLTPSQTKTVKLKFTVSELTAGNYFLIGVIDQGGAFVDENQVNNIAVSPTQVAIQ